LAVPPPPKAEDTWTEEIERITRRRECLYRWFVYACATACLLLLLLCWSSLDW
jgi:hypothetical protein